MSLWIFLVQAGKHVYYFRYMQVLLKYQIFCLTGPNSSFLPFLFSTHFAPTRKTQESKSTRKLLNLPLVINLFI